MKNNARSLFIGVGLALCGTTSLTSCDLDKSGFAAGMNNDFISRKSYDSLENVASRQKAELLQVQQQLKHSQKSDKDMLAIMERTSNHVDKHIAPIFQFVQQAEAIVDKNPNQIGSMTVHDMNTGAPYVLSLSKNQINPQ